MFKVVVFAFLLQFCYGYNPPYQINRLARENYKLVPYFGNKYMKKYKLNYDEREEMIQEGYVGFMYACRKYDEERGLKFSTYGRFWIIKYMKDYIYKKYKYNQMIDIDNQQIPSYDHINELCFDLLTEKEKDIIFKRYFQNMKIMDIACDYNVCRDTVTNWIKVAIKKLKIKN